MATRRKPNFLAQDGGAVCLLLSARARVVELVDTQVSEACASRCSGSSPLPGTISELKTVNFSLKFSRIFAVTSPAHRHYGAIMDCFSRLIAGKVSSWRAEQNYGLLRPPKASG